MEVTRHNYERVDLEDLTEFLCRSLQLRRHRYVGETNIQESAVSQGGVLRLTITLHARAGLNLRNLIESFITEQHD